MWRLVNEVGQSSEVEDLREGHGEETSPSAGEGMSDVVALLGAGSRDNGSSGLIDWFGHVGKLAKHRRAWVEGKKAQHDEVGGMRGPTWPYNRGLKTRRADCMWISGARLLCPGSPMQQCSSLLGLFAHMEICPSLTAGRAISDSLN